MVIETKGRELFIVDNTEKAQEGDLWRHEKILLEPVSPDFEPIVLTDADEGELQVIAELIEVLEN